MKTPVQIDFRGMRANERMSTAISTRIADLEQRFGRVTACRIIVKAPSGHHQTGGPYEVSVRLALPNGREVNVGRTAKADERLSDPSFAIHDAFQRARRRLQDHVRRMQGQVKTRSDVPSGTVSRIDPVKGFGFLQTADGRDIYFHRNSVLGRGFAKLEVGARVMFHEEVGEKGAQASTVKLIGKHRMR